uniref:ribonuclease H n=1 Tax=Sinocyclocheilus anshuiensis TaxID=1608454 RepID=A0A671NBT6_9TELE
MTLTFSNHSEDLPYVTLMVHGQPQTFLLDSGADVTSMTTAHYKGPLSNQIVNSVGISGTDIACPVTPPLEVRAPGFKPFFHKFTIIPGAPINLLGRDMMHKLNMDIKFTDKQVVFSFLSSLQVSINPLHLNVKKEIHFKTSCHTKSGRFCRMAKPYKAKLKTNKPVYIKQYPLSKDKELGIKPLIDNFIQQGVLISIHSPYNTPIDPVVKADGKTWRLTQDLRAINQLIMPLALIVPDVPTVINSIPCTHKYFTVIDLYAAFFSVPVHPDTQPILAFTFQGLQLSWTRLDQGYIDSPAVFAAAVQRTLAKMTDLMGDLDFQLRHTYYCTNVDFTFYYAFHFSHHIKRNLPRDAEHTKHADICSDCC